MKEKKMYVPADPPQRGLWMVYKKVSPFYCGWDLVGVVWAATPEDAVSALALEVDEEGLEARPVNFEVLEPLGMDVIIHQVRGSCD
jgi:hypothetical protein